MKRLSINQGYITNSSSVTHWFDPQILEDPDVKSFMSAYGLASNVNGNPWYRNEISFACTPEGWDGLQDSFVNHGYDFEVTIPDIGPAGSVVFVYGDEYTDKDTWLHNLLKIMSKANAQLNLPSGSDYYN